MKRLTFRYLVFVLLLIWCAGFANTLFLNKGQSAVVNLALTSFYSPVCHQLPTKAITTASGNFLICSRCTGIYFGAMAAAAVYLFRRKINLFLLLPAVIIMILDVLMVSLNIYNYSRPAAFSTGLFFGLTLFPYILSTIENSFWNNEIK